MNTLKKTVVREAVFQTLLLAVVFLFYVSDRSHGHSYPEVKAYDIPFFLNYAVAAMLINYVLLPKFLYRKKYLWFLTSLAAILALVIVVEEEVLEQIYFPTTRGSRFPGVFVNLVGALPTITILTGFKFAWDALYQRRQLEELKMTVKESEMQFLKSQINPHFLFNNLNNLYAYALEKSDKTPDIILGLSGVLRYMLYECREEYVPIRKEIEQLKNFIKISQLQIEDRGEIRLEVGEIYPEYRIAPLVLMVFVENAVKHSASSMSEGIRIDIRVEMREEEMHFVCNNTYSEQSTIENLSSGIGLSNVRKRLELIYPGAYSLDTRSDGSEYRVLLRVKLSR